MRTLGIVLGALVLALAPSVAAQGKRASDGIQPADALGGVLMRCTSESRDRSAQELAALDVGLAPLFQVLAAGHFPVRVGEAGNSHRSLSRAQRALLLEAIGRRTASERAALFGPLVARSGEPPRESDRRVALEVLGAVGVPGELDLLVRLARPAEARERVPRELREAFGASLERFLERHPKAVQRMPDLFRDLHPSLALPTVAALSARPSRARLASMVDPLGGNPRLDLLLLPAIGRQAAALPHPLDEQLLLPVRRLLAAEAPQLVVEAVLATAALEDRQAVPALIALLRHADPNVRAKALQALRSLSDRQLPPDAERWSEWHASELAWWSSEAPRVLATLRRGPAAEVSRLVLELSKKRFFRHELAEPLAAVLGRPQKDLVVLACAALGHLASPRGVPALVATLEHGDPQVQACAWRALQRISGLDLEPDPAAWRAVARGLEEHLR